MKKKMKPILTNKKWQLGAAITVTALFVIAGVCVAWFSYTDGLKTVVKIKEPTAIQIRAGNADDIEQLDLGNINVKDALEDGAVLSEDGTTYTRRYVFCVCAEADAYSSEGDEYVIQLAHTTNLNFTYKIYAATEQMNSEGDVKYTDTSGGVHYYSYSESQDSLKLNSAVESAMITSSKTYGDYKNVQQNAIPVYYQSSSIKEHDHIEETYNDTQWKFVDFYILEVSWNEEEAKGWLDKESDMVYLFAYSNS